MMPKNPVIGLVAGEASGDRLGATLIAALRESLPQARFVGMTGPHMAAEGCRSLADIDALSVMGLAEILVHLPRLLKLRKKLANDLVDAGIDVLIGIDSPDFNLGLERRCRERGIHTVHYVSPSVWAWRQGRVRTVARAAELVLCLLPFEPACYRDVDVRAEFVGHPLVDALVPGSVLQARAALGLEERGRVLAVLPGSREGEVRRLLPPFLAAAQALRETRADLDVAIPIAHPGLRPLVEAECARLPDLEPRLVDGRAHEVITAADAVLVASGTATLETLLLGRPMVAAYRMTPLTAWLLLRAGLLKSRYFALPNLIAGRQIVPELAQAEVDVARISASVAPLLDDERSREAQLAAFAEVRRGLGQAPARRAAELVKELLLD